MDKYVLITGAGSGIGEALAVNLSHKGYNIVAIGRRELPLQQLKEKINTTKCIIIHGDVSNKDDRKKIFNYLKKENIQLQIIVNNAGMIEPFGELISLTEKKWNDHFSINLNAPLFLTKTLYPLLLKPSRILNISSGAAYKVIENWGAYCVSKTALSQISKQMNAEMFKDNVLVTSVHPGIVDTNSQDIINKADDVIFPKAQHYRNLKINNKLITSEISAAFLTWLLIESEDEIYAKQDWSLYNEDNYKYWKKKNDFVPALN